MSNLMQNLGTKIGGEFKTHRIRIESVEANVATKANQSDVYTKAEVDTKIGASNSSDVAVALAIALG